MWCLFKHIPGSWFEARGHLPVCYITWGHDGCHAEVYHAFDKLQGSLFKALDICFLIVKCFSRPGVPGAPLPARAVLSMTGLSHGVIRVNTEDKNSALTVQDVGHVMPGGVCVLLMLILYTTNQKFGIIKIFFMLKIEKKFLMLWNIITI